MVSASPASDPKASGANPSARSARYAGQKPGSSRSVSPSTTGDEEYQCRAITMPHSLQPRTARFDRPRSRDRPARQRDNVPCPPACDRTHPRGGLGHLPWPGCARRAGALCRLHDHRVQGERPSECRIRTSRRRPDQPRPVRPQLRTRPRSDHQLPCAAAELGVLEVQDNRIKALTLQTLGRARVELLRRQVVLHG